MEINGKSRRVTVGVPTENKVQPSVVFHRMEEDFGPTTVAPTRLGIGFNKEGEKISPFFKAFKKLNNFTKNIPQQLHDDIVEHCTNSINSWPSNWNKNNQRLLTWEESVNGYMNLKSIDLSTSSGFPFTLTSTNKKKWFTMKDNKWCMNEEPMNKCLEMEDKLKQGIVPPIYFVDTLKDELRPIKKVDDFKTGIDLRDEHFKKHLGLEKTPKITMKNISAENGTGTGTLSVNGVEKTVQFTYKKESEKKLRAEFKVKNADFKLPSANYMGVGVEDEVTVS